MAIRPMRAGTVALPHQRRLTFARPLVMGIVNVTPDSFSDGGRFLEPSVALEHAGKLEAEGADILDIGGESTRPGHVEVEVEEELRRVLPVVEGLASGATIVSIDTMKARVAEAAIVAGASIINDVWGFQRDKDMARVVADTGAFAVAMHNRETMDAAIDILADVRAFLSRSIDSALAAGVAESKIAIDPGFGFGKSHQQSLSLVRDLPSLCELGFPVLLGVSRKRAIGSAAGRADPADRLAASLACALIGVDRGASILRVHDVGAHVDGLAVRAAILEKGGDA